MLGLLVYVVVFAAGCVVGILFGRKNKAEADALAKEVSDLKDKLSNVSATQAKG